MMPILDLFFGASYDDMRRMEAVLGASDVNWISLRPPRLVDRPGVGAYRVQSDLPLPKAPRISRVVVTSSSDKKLAKARKLGASATVDYRAHPDVAEQVLEWSDGDGVDHVIETVGGDNLNHSLSAVKIGGTISFIGLIAGTAARINTYEFVTKNVTLHGIETGSRDMFDEMTRFIDQHDIKPVIDSTFPRSEIANALQRLKRGGHFGKIVLTR